MSQRINSFPPAVAIAATGGLPLALLLLLPPPRCAQL
jgi:hypothetical protein